MVLELIEGVNAMVGPNWADLDLHRSLGDIYYNADLDLTLYTAMLDWHVLGGTFRLTGGLIWNENKAALQATPADTIGIGGIEYAAGDADSLTARIRYDDQLIPYVGLAWGNAIGQGGRVGLLVDLGVPFTGAPEARLSASGPITTDPDFQDSLAQEQQALNEDLDNFKFYPVLALSLFVRF